MACVAAHHHRLRGRPAPPPRPPPAAPRPGRRSPRAGTSAGRRSRRSAPAGRPGCRPGAAPAPGPAAPARRRHSSVSTMPPCWVISDAISLRTSPQMPSDRGAANACSWIALLPSTRVAAIDRAAGDLDPQLHALHAGHQQTAEVHPALCGVLHLGRVPGAVGPLSGRGDLVEPSSADADSTSSSDSARPRRPRHGLAVGTSLFSPHRLEYSCRPTPRTVFARRSVHYSRTITRRAPVSLPGRSPVIGRSTRSRRCRARSRQFAPPRRSGPFSTRCTTSWAIRSPRRKTTGSRGSRLTTITLISPRYPASTVPGC